MVQAEGEEIERAGSQNRFVISGADAYFQPMLGKPIELPPDVARRFFKDLRAFLAEKNTIKADAIAVRQLQVLRLSVSLLIQEHAQFHYSWQKLS